MVAIPITICQLGPGIAGKIMENPYDLINERKAKNSQINENSPQNEHVFVDVKQELPQK